MVNFGYKYLPQSQLNSIVPCVWRMIRPPEGLFQVIRGTVVNTAPHCKQEIPVKQRFFISIFNSKSFFGLHFSSNHKLNCYLRSRNTLIINAENKSMVILFTLYCKAKG